MTERYLRVKVHPRAGRDAVKRLGEDAFEVWVRAKPIEGQANEALLALLARFLEIPRDKLQLVRGTTGRNKRIRVRA